MTQSIRNISQFEVRATASGVLFMALFGTLWAYTGTMGLHGLGGSLPLIATTIIGIALIIVGISLIRDSRKLPIQVPTKRDRKRIGFWFNIVFIGEGLAIGIAIAICNATSRLDLIPIVIAIIVGLHFIPLAPLFQVRLYYLTGALLCLNATFTWLFIPLKMTLRAHEINSYMTVVGFGSALILWGTGLAISLMGKRLLRASEINGQRVGAQDSSV